MHLSFESTHVLLNGNDLQKVICYVYFMVSSLRGTRSLISAKVNKMYWCSSILDIDRQLNRRDIEGNMILKSVLFIKSCEHPPQINPRLRQAKQTNVGVICVVFISPLNGKAADGLHLPSALILRMIMLIMRWCMNKNTQSRRHFDLLQPLDHILFERQPIRPIHQHKPRLTFCYSFKTFQDNKYVLIYLHFKYWISTVRSAVCLSSHLISSSSSQ